MQWTEIKILSTQEAQDAIFDMLTSIGAGGVAIEDPFEIRSQINAADSLDYADDEFLNSLGEDVIIEAYFPEGTNIPELTSTIKEKLTFISKFLDVGKGLSEVIQVEEQDWANTWKQYYKTFHLTDKIVIKPSWEDYEGSKDEIIIEMEPGMAFGTGTHETTKMCGILLEKYLTECQSVMDVGCGTGILSIIAAKLGSKKILALDVDSVAVRVARENCSINGVIDKVTLQKSAIEGIKNQKVDVIVANIIASVLVNIASDTLLYINDSGVLILSGIIKERRDEVLEAYLKIGYQQIEEMIMGEWVAIVLRCQDFL